METLHAGSARGVQGQEDVAGPARILGAAACLNRPSWMQPFRASRQAPSSGEIRSPGREVIEGSGTPVTIHTTRRLGFLG